MESTEARDDLATIEPEVRSIQVARDYQIGNAAEAEYAGDQLQRVQGLIKRVEAARTAELVEPLQVVAEIRSRWKEPADLLESAKTVLKGAVGLWLNKVREEQRRIEDERQRKEAVERARVAAEQAAAESAARAKAEALRKEAEAAAAAGNAAAAAKLEERAAGQDEKADIVAAGATEAIAAVSLSQQPTAAAQKLAGISGGTTYRAEVRNLRQFMASCLADEFLDLDAIFAVKLAGINALAKQYKMATPSKYPGLIAVPDVRVAARAK